MMVLKVAMVALREVIPIHIPTQQRATRLISMVEMLSKALSAASRSVSSPNKTLTPPGPMVVVRVTTVVLEVEVEMVPSAFVTVTVTPAGTAGGGAANTWRVFWL